MLKMSKSKTSLLTISVLMAFLSLGLTNVQCADSTAASLELSSNSYLADTMVTIRAYDVTAAGSEFRIYFTYDLTGTDTLESTSKFSNITVYLDSDSDEFVITRNFPAPTAGAYVRVHIVPESDPGGTDLADSTIYVQKFEDLVNLDLFITIGVYMMIILVLVGITMGLARKARGSQ